MNIVFISSTKFGKRCLEGIIKLPEVTVIGIITNPESFKISYRPSGVRNILHEDFSDISIKHNIPVWVMADKMSNAGLIGQITKWKPDFILVAGWYHMIPKKIRDIAPTGGLHASLLPDYSGGAPLVWAIINGEKKTGITFFLMDDGVDSGPIIGQKEEPIYWEDTIETLYRRIEDRGLELLREYLPKISKETVTYLSQDESKRRVMPQRSPEDGQINLQWSSERIYNFIRAQTRPYPGAFFKTNNQQIYVWKSEIMDNNYCIEKLSQDLHFLSDGKLFFRCGDGKILKILDYSFHQGI